MFFKKGEALRILVEQGIVMLKPEEQEKCPHVKWEPEAPENNWRSYCLKCGLRAQGSCQE